jgi:hypothetical protein
MMIRKYIKGNKEKLRKKVCEELKNMLGRVEINSVYFII